MEEDKEVLLPRGEEYIFGEEAILENDIKILEEYRDDELFGVAGRKALENLLTRYKQLDSLIGEIDNKEVNDALHTLLHCSLKDTEYETQKQQFEIVNAYIKQLEEENKQLKVNEEILLKTKGCINEDNSTNCRVLESLIYGIRTYEKTLEKLQKETIWKSKAKEIIEEYINSILENLDEDRRWCDMELVDNFEALKAKLLREE